MLLCNCLKGVSLVTFCTLVTSVILYQGLKASASQIITIVLAFAVICTGIIILQMTKIDPRQLANVRQSCRLQPNYYVLNSSYPG